jgi:hypothetical protein
VLGAIDRIGRPDPRLRHNSGRELDFSGVATGAKVATRNFFGLRSRAEREHQHYTPVMGITKINNINRSSLQLVAPLEFYFNPGPESSIQYSMGH